MCKGGGSSASTIDPRIMQMLQSNYHAAQNVAYRRYQPYTGQLTADLTPSQQQAGALLQSAPSVGQDALNTAVEAAQNATSYEAPMIAAPAVSAALANAALMNNVQQ